LNKGGLQLTKSGIKKPFLPGFFTAFCLVICVCFSCGIEDYIYLDAVDRTTDSNVTGAQFVLPYSSTSMYFRNYAIYYRIYLSDYNTVVNTVLSSEERNRINPALNSHFNTIDPYITNDNILPGGIGPTFERLKYYQLYVSLDKINEIDLSYLFSTGGYDSLPGVRPGGRIDLYFSNPTVGPYMTMDYDTASTQLYLFRSNKASPFPKEDRLFFQSNDSFDINNITPENNLDVEKAAGSTNTTKTAYVSMYILAEGIDFSFSRVYSRPLHLGIFKLDRFWF